ncbi:uncharacterized protein LOC118469483 [Amphiprion ocellaris]|uniref:uncharacterized protein LOC118469483 n=1 Tax=Amphiprion ocellaris TaxID=80972 RepID=UPI00164A0463|nr:uncharacterized protein LOC118469483 [Amphiprion ocellaris]
MEQSWPVRVVVGESDIRKVTFHKRPDTLEELLSELKKRLGLQYNFMLHYEDPDFNNAFCNLTDISELPDRPTLKIISLENVGIILSAASPSSSASALSSTYARSSPNSSDTEILPHTEETTALTSHDPWPSTFEVPYFSVNTEYRLRQGNLIYMRDGTRKSVSRDMKHDILQKLAEEMYKFSAYPQDEHFTTVAAALIAKHPCLAEPGSPMGCYGWKNSLKFKMGNFRSKLRRCGIADVVVNGNKRAQQNPDGDPPRKNLKRPRRSETNFLPDIPLGQDASVLERSRQLLENEMKKRFPDVALVNQLMSQTFSLRRKEIVEEQPSVKQMLGRWPALFRKQQVFAEFTRVASQDLEQDFFESLDRHTPRFLEIFKSKGGMVGRTLAEILAQVETRTRDVRAMRTAVLRCLPVFLGDDGSEFFKVCFDSHATADVTQVPVGVLTVIPEDSQLPGPHALPLEPSSTAIILEGIIVMDDIESHAQAFCILFGLIYALHLDYPKRLKNIFDFIQRVMLNIGYGHLRPKLQSLKNALLQ